MNNLRKLIASIILLSLFFISCDKGFQETNIDPNRVQQISPSSLLNEIIYNISVNNDLNYIAVTSRLMQVHIPYPQAFGGVQRYQILSSTGNSIWNSGYK